MNTDSPSQALFSPAQIDQIHHNSIIIDMHADTIQRVLDEGADLVAGTPGWQVDIPMMQRGGLKAQFFSIWPDPFEYWGDAAYQRAKALIGALDEQLEKHPNYIRRALSADDIRRIVKANKIAALMGIEGGHAINDDLAALKEFYARGVRYMTLTHSRSTAWAGSSGDEEGRQKGLSDLGREIVREMNNLGMIVDISHVSDKTFWDVMTTASKPMIASHSAARTLSNHHRNLTDEMIRAVADAGGVICVVFYPIFLDETYAQSARAILTKLKPHFEEATAHLDKVAAGYEKDRLSYEALCQNITPMPLARLADHIDHIAKLVGTDHIGIGSDFDGINCTPQGLETVAQLPALTHELARRGYSQSDLEKVLGGNILRVMDAQN